MRLAFPAIAFLAFASVLIAPPVHAQRASRCTRSLDAPNEPGSGNQGLGPGTVVDRRKISTVAGGFPEDTLDGADRLGQSVIALGDVNGDGFTDLAAGTDDFKANGGLFDGLTAFGAVFVLFLDGTGGLIGHQKIGNDGGGLAGSLEGIGFGSALAPLGDLDGNGTPDLATVSQGESSFFWVLFLDPDGSVRSYRRTSGFLGTALATLGDLDGDGVTDVAAGLPEDAPQVRGAVEILFLRPDGTIRARQKIDEQNGGFTGALPNGGRFGSSVASPGDLDGDGVRELAVGTATGALWILFLAANGTVQSHERIPDSGAQLGASLAGIGDLDGDGTGDLVAGAPLDDDGGHNRGAARVLFLAPDGSVSASQEISQVSGGLVGPLPDDGMFGFSVAGLGDIDGDALADIAAGAPQVDGGGALWLLALRPDGTVRAELEISDRPGSLEGTLDPQDRLGKSTVALGDLDGNGVRDLAVGATGDDDSGRNSGAVWILLHRADGSLEGAHKLSARAEPFFDLASLDDFGRSVAALGDLDGDGIPDLAVGAAGDDDGGDFRGAAWVLFLNADGSVKAHQKISSTQGGLAGPLSDGDSFGSALASLGDLGGDGTLELAVGAALDGASDIGAVWVISLGSDGRVVHQQKLGPMEGGLAGVPIGPSFGIALCSLGDLDGDGTTDLAVGEVRDEVLDSGRVWILFLDPDGTVRAHQEIGRNAGGFTGVLGLDDHFARSLASGDLDGDGRTDLVVGAPLSASGSNRFGALWVLFLGPDGRVRSHQKISRTQGGLGIDLNHDAEFGSALAALGDRDGDGVDDLVVGSAGDWDGGNHGALWLLSLDGIARTGFEHGDDTARTPLVNGQSLVSSAAFTRAITLTSSGANLGAAIFDSTPLGPNDPSQDRDLLVGKGHLLILQNSQAPTQNVPGVFARPNDDQDGGLLVFRFPAPSAPLTLDLVDIDPGSVQHAHVELVDAAGSRRTYSIPGGWTQDLLTHGPPAWRTLDLTTLDPQAGFAATATASELAGFNPRAIVRIEVELGSSGAVDELRWDPHPDS